jgi:hypothetical protein
MSRHWCYEFIYPRKERHLQIVVSRNFKPMEFLESGGEYRVLRSLVKKIPNARR